MSRVIRSESVDGYKLTMFQSALRKDQYWCQFQSFGLGHWQGFWVDAEQGVDVAFAAAKERLHKFVSM